jgi:hypothetical protein
VANVRITGSTLDGSTLTTNWLAFPISVCTGCLVRYPPSAADPVAEDPLVLSDHYQCISVAGDARKGPPCVLGQDEPFPRVLCAETHPLCVDPKLNPSNPPVPD